MVRMPTVACRDGEDARRREVAINLDAPIRQLLLEPGELFTGVEIVPRLHRAADAIEILEHARNNGVFAHVLVRNRMPGVR